MSELWWGGRVCSRVADKTLTLRPAKLPLRRFTNHAKLLLPALLSPPQITLGPEKWRSLSTQ